MTYTETEPKGTNKTRKNEDCVKKKKQDPDTTKEESKKGVVKVEKPPE